LVDEICVFLGLYAAKIGSLLPTFRDNPSGQVVPKRRQQTTNIRCLKSQKSADLIHTTAEA